MPCNRLHPQLRIPPTGVPTPRNSFPCRTAVSTADAYVERHFQGNLPMFPFGTHYPEGPRNPGRLAQRHPMNLPPWARISPLPEGAVLSKDPSELLFNA